MIYVELFWNFLMIGALSFGGGYGMISLVRETVLSHGWLTESEFLSFIAVSESTPGPLAVNMATFIGSSQGGLLGAFFATLGVVLPSFVIILLIAAVLQNLMKYAGGGSVPLRGAALRCGDDPGHGPDHGALHAGGLHDRGRRVLRFSPVGGGIRPFVGSALRLQKGNKKSPLADRNDRSGSRAGHPVLGRLTHSGEVSIKKQNAAPQVRACRAAFRYLQRDKIRT